MIVGDKWESFKRFFIFRLTMAFLGNTYDIKYEENTNILIQNWFQELKQKISKSREK